MEAHPDIAQLQEEAVGLVEILATRCAPARTRLTQRPVGAMAVLQAMQRHLEVASVQARCCALLANLAADGSHASENLAASGALELLLAAVRTHVGDVQVQSWGLMALQNFWCGSGGHSEAYPEQLRHRAQDLGSPEVLLARLQNRKLMAGTSEDDLESTAKQLQAICVVALHCLAGNDKACRDTLSETLEGSAVQLCSPALDATVVLEVRERACQLICQLLSERNQDAHAAMGRQLAESVLAAMQDHLAAAAAEDAETERGLPAGVPADDDEETEETLVLPSPCYTPSSSSTSPAGAECCRLRATWVSSTRIIVAAMRAFPAEPRIQAAGCRAFQRLALAAARGRGRDRHALLQDLLGIVELIVGAFREHGISAEVQRLAVLAIQGLLLFSSSSFGECQAAVVARLQDMGFSELLLRAITTYPGDATLQENGLPALRTLARAGPEQLLEITQMGTAEKVIAVLKLNMARPLIQ
ncbi:unnamed protein product, partial [Polarella glacialis]